MTIIIIFESNPKSDKQAYRGQSLKYGNKRSNQGNQYMKQGNIHVNLVHFHVFNISIEGILTSM